ncbi:Cell division control protein 48 B [Geranomyces michiganensis]|nr:Cell division control protein 48 B [Geranomyces michiganensis]
MDIDRRSVLVASDIPANQVVLTAELAKQRNLREGQLCEVKGIPLVGGNVCRALLQVAVLDALTQFSSHGGAADVAQVVIPGWLGKLWVAQDVSATGSPDSLRLAPFAMPPDMHFAFRLMIRQIGNEPWVPTTVGLERVRASGKPSPMDFLDFPATITNALPKMVYLAVTNILANVTLKVTNDMVFTVPLLGRDAIFKIDSVEDENGNALKVAVVDSAKCTAVLGTPLSLDSLITGDAPAKLGGFEADVDELAGLIEIAAANKDAERNRLTSAEFVGPLIRCMEKAKLKAPAVVILELEMLEDDYKSQDLDRAAVASEITAQVSQLGSSSGVCVVASASNLQKLPAVFRRKADGGGFDRVIDISVPNREQREMILRDLLQNIPLAQDPEIIPGSAKSLVEAYAFRVSNHTAGFVAHNLRCLISQATRHAISRLCKEAATGDIDKLAASLTLLNVAVTPGQSPTVNWREDFVHAFTIVGPAHVAFESTKPHVRWESMGGYEELKTRVRQLATWPSQRPEVYMKLGVSPPAGLLLYGPSGCGKTLLVHALAATSPMNYISVKGSEIYSKYLGESENMVRKLFAAARRLEPCLLFLDELDAIGTRREWSDDGGSGVNERVLSTLLNEMDGVQERKGVFVIACTMRPDKIDDALLRPGRLDHHLYVALPTVKDRRAILDTLQKSPTGERIFDSDVDLDRLATLTDEFTGADLTVLIRESGIQALRASPTASTIAWTHIQAALDGAIRDTGDDSDPFESSQPMDSDDGEEDGEVVAQPTEKRKWWRPAWVDKDQIAGYEKFKLGREK